MKKYVILVIVNVLINVCMFFYVSNKTQSFSNEQVFTTLNKNINDWNVYLNKHLIRQDSQIELLERVIKDEVIMFKQLFMDCMVILEKEDNEAQKEIHDWVDLLNEQIKVVISNQKIEEQNQRDRQEQIRKWLEIIYTR